MGSKFFTRLSIENNRGFVRNALDSESFKKRSQGLFYQKVLKTSHDWCDRPLLNQLKAAISQLI